MKKKIIIGTIVVITLIILLLIIFLGQNKDSLNVSDYINLSYNDNSISLELDNEKLLTNQVMTEDMYRSNFSGGLVLKDNYDITVTPNSFSYDEIDDNTLKYTVEYGVGYEENHIDTVGEGSIDYSINKVVNSLETQKTEKESEINSLKEEIKSAEEYHEEKIKDLEEQENELGGGILSKSISNKIEEEQNKERSKWYSKGSKRSVGDLESEVSKIQEEINVLTGEIERFQSF